jgi:hypothetical protein
LECETTSVIMITSNAVVGFMMISMMLPKSNSGGTKEQKVQTVVAISQDGTADFSCVCEIVEVSQLWGNQKPKPF